MITAAVALLSLPVVLIGVLVASLAVPVMSSWRTGEPGPPLPRPSGAELRLAAPDPGQPTRLWIDTDAACGHSATADPDDCLAILLLAAAPEVEIVGISTVHGNAALEVTDRITRRLVQALSQAGIPPVPVYRGAAVEQVGRHRSAAGTRPSAARAALADAIAAAPLTIVALGPLTNVAEVLDARPDLRARVQRLVAVGGRRPGHLFHPSEGSDGGAFLGHGPVFRDFNVAQDPSAAVAVLAAGVPLTLVPYEAAREIRVAQADVARLAAAGNAASWVAARLGPWLAYWRDDVGISGFYPFDLVAAAHLLAPRMTRCADVTAWVGVDRQVLFGWGPLALLVTQDGDTGDTALAEAPAVYCTGVDARLKTWILDRLAPGDRR